MIKEIIKNTLERVLQENQKNSKTAYRTPLIGYGEANNPLFSQLKTAVAPNHLLPSDLLPEADTVVAFFLPFTEALVQNNRNHPYVARSWAIAYIETNSLIIHCCEELSAALAKQGIRAAWQQPTHNFDPVKLCSQWSHKHVAYICGLGTFGLHHMLITSSGCAGRFGSLVIDFPLTPSPLNTDQLCHFFRDGKCLACVKKCPSGALTPEGLDKQICYKYLLEADSYYNDLGLCDVCGKCATWGPCAVIS